MMREIALHENAAPGVKHVRMNCTVRWHNTHYEGCPVQTADAGGTQPVLTGAVQVSASTFPRTAASVAAPAAASTQGTQPVVTGAVRESAASMILMDPYNHLYILPICIYIYVYPQNGS